MQRLLFVCVTLVLAACSVPRTSLADRARSVEVQLAALDSEALYTIAGGLKPVSEGFWHEWVDAAAPDLSAFVAVHEALAVWRNEDLWADVHLLHHEHDGRRAARAYVVDRAALRALIRREAVWFARWGIVPDSHPAAVLAVVERLPAPERHRGQGLLFGYPRHAIDFFVRANEAQQAGAPLVPRRFVQIPTFGAETGRFVYAVPEHWQDGPADLELATKAAHMLSRYRELRAGLCVDGATAGDVGHLVATLRSEFSADARVASSATRGYPPSIACSGNVGDGVSSRAAMRRRRSSSSRSRAARSSRSPGSAVRS
jgi:hypothetical protein